MTAGMTPIDRLIATCCRELAQAERSALVHPRREGRRLGDVPPGRALLAISEHAEANRQRLASLLRSRAGAGVAIGRVLGELFSDVRHGVVDRLIDSERSYRGTLLGLEHGRDLVRLIAAAARRTDDPHLLAFCDEWLLERGRLIDVAHAALAWFAEHPERALQSGFGQWLASARKRVIGSGSTAAAGKGSGTLAATPVASATPAR